MNKFKLFLSLLFIILVMPQVATAKVDTMTVSEITPGMTGIGRTVISGTEVEEFDVEILGVIQKGGFAGGPMILARSTGAVIDKTGGVAGGYSGSPVYINGKMIGAISAGWYFADHTVCGITPIHEMLKNFNYPDTPEGEIKIAKLDNPIELFDRTIDSTVLTMGISESSELASQVGENTMVLTACKTPLFVNGVNPELVEIVKEQLGPYLPYVEIMAGTGSSMSSFAPGIPLLQGPSEIEPGSAIGMQLVTGDIDLTAIGTLTYVDPDDPEKKILAFGHPFLSKGRVDAPLTSARIVFTVPAMDRSFKIGEAIEIIGVSHQDRACAISGYIGKMPKLVDIKISISDLDQNRTKQYKIGALQDEDLLPFLVLIPLMQAMNFTVDRNGQATTSMDFTIKGEGLAEPITRKNIFFSTSGAYSVITEPLEVLTMLTSSNIFREVKISEINIDIKVTENRQTLDLVEIEFAEDITGEKPKDETTPKALTSETPDSDTRSVETILGNLQEIPDDAEIPEEAKQAMMQKIMMSQGEEAKKFAPGDKIRVKVLIKPYRDEMIEQFLEIKIPDDISPGVTQIEVRGGGGFPNRFMNGASQAFIFPGDGIPFPIGNIGMPMEKPPKTLDEVIEKFLERDHNNELIIELKRPRDNRDKDQNKDQSEKPEPIKETISTDKVIYGTFQLPLEIKKPDSEKDDKNDIAPEIEKDAGKEPTKESKDKRGSSISGAGKYS